jgi:uncharacterized protein YbjT (DUF2867 family)
LNALVTTANGMFGHAVARALADRGANVRAMVRDRSKFTFVHPLVEVVTADLDDPRTLPAVFQGVQSVFLASPMDPRLADRECAALGAARDAGVRRVVKIHGAVRHEGRDALSRMHQEVLDALYESGMEWTLVSPSSVMETSLLGYAESIRSNGAFFGMSGRGKIGLVALGDVAEAAALVLTTDGHAGQNYELTGPESLDLFQVAEAFARALGRPVAYRDMPEQALKNLLLQVLPMSEEALEISVLCHLRCWRDGKADLVTDTFERLTGKMPTSVEQWIRQRADLFGR